MPIYEYRCTTCSALVDIHHGFDETNSDACATCGGELTRNFSVGGIVFKGAGFYKTDSQGGDKSEAAVPAPAPVPASDSTNAA